MENQTERDILTIEKEIDEAIESEDYEKLNTLLDEREKLLPKLTENELREIYQRDQQRMKVLEEKMKKFKETAIKAETGKKMVQSYIQTEDKGQEIDRRG
uniref:Flagellar protein FliT n=2 Tax=Fervidobacterium pennivorans TaxID=93466 RepID=A0A7V4NF31_FERPE